MASPPQSDPVPDCIFCGIVAGSLPAEIIDSDEHTVTLMDINPATRGHALVIPRKHAADLIEIERRRTSATAPSPPSGSPSAWRRP